MMVFEILIDLDKRPPNIRNVVPIQIHQDEFQRSIAEGMVITRNEFIEKSPIGGTGLMRNAWVTDGPRTSGNTVRGKVVNSTVQALVDDGGARPHTPPGGDNPALGQWIRRKLGISEQKRIRKIAFFIGRKFRKKGIKEKETFKDAFKFIEPQIDAAMIRGVDRIVRRLAEK